jgi:N-methylhydantoinase B/oxoprolinase/acetone carboxylase alpha subunit
VLLRELDWPGKAVNPQRVLNDFADGVVSREEASQIYGVVIDGDNGALNFLATEKLRANLRQERLQK